MYKANDKIKLSDVEQRASSKRLGTKNFRDKYKHLEHNPLVLLQAFYNPLVLFAVDMAFKTYS